LQYKKIVKRNLKLLILQTKLQLIEDFYIWYLQRLNKKFAKIDCKTKYKINKIIKQITSNTKTRQLIKLTKFIKIQNIISFAK